MLKKKLLIAAAVMAINPCGAFGKANSFDKHLIATCYKTKSSVYMYGIGKYPYLLKDTKEHEKGMFEETKIFKDISRKFISIATVVDNGWSAFALYKNNTWYNMDGQKQDLNILANNISYTTKKPTEIIVIKTLKDKGTGQNNMTYNLILDKNNNGILTLTLGLFEPPYTSYSVFVSKCIGKK